jgi:hypothetical protein
VHSRVKAIPRSVTRIPVAKVVAPGARAAPVVVGMERRSRQVASVSEWPAIAEGIIGGVTETPWVLITSGHDRVLI